MSMGRMRKRLWTGQAGQKKSCGCCSSVDPNGFCCMGLVGLIEEKWIVCEQGVRNVKDGECQQAPTDEITGRRRSSRVLARCCSAMENSRQTKRDKIYTPRRVNGWLQLKGTSRGAQARFNRRRGRHSGEGEPPLNSPATPFCGPLCTNQVLQGEGEQ